MKWIILAIGLIFCAEFAITRDSVTLMFGLLFIGSAISVWKDDDAL